MCKKVEFIDDVVLEIEECSCKVIFVCFKDFLKKIDVLQKEYRDVFVNLNVKKQEILICIEIKVEEIKFFIDKVYN